MWKHKIHYTIRVASGFASMLLLVSITQAQELAIGDLRYQTPYRFVKTAVTDAFNAQSTLESRKYAVLKAAETAYGSRAKTVLGGGEDLLARVDGGEALTKRFGVGNRSVRKGALRALRVARAIDNDSRFKLLALDQPVLDKRGRIRTDRDIVYRSRSTGARGRIEVKDVTIATQRSNLHGYKRQIRLMGEEQKRTGQAQAFVNRRPVSPALKQYAKNHGVRVYENVVTSRKNMDLPNVVPATTVLDDLDREAKSRARTRQAGIGFGAAFVILEGANTVKAWGAYRNGDETFSQAGYQTALTGAGASFVTRGVATDMLTRVNPSGRAASYLRGVSRFAGPAGMAFTGVAMGFRGYQFYTGEISTRQFVMETSTTTGGIAGGLLGAWTGAAIGGFGGPFAIVTVPAGAIIGGVGGAWLGSTVASAGVESMYGRLDEAQKQELFRQLALYYQTQANSAQ